MERELVELFRAATKAADAAALDGVSPKVDRCIEVLNRLKSFPVTYDVLVRTQVAKGLRPLTKHPEKQIQTKASDVIEIWKKIIISEATKMKRDGVDIRSPKKTVVTEARTVKIEEVRKTASVVLEKVPKTEDSMTKAANVSRSGTLKVEKQIGTVGTAADERKDRRESVKVENTPKEEKPASSMKKPVQASNAPPKLTSMIKCNDALRDKMRELLLEALSKVSSEADEDMKDEVDACDPIRVAVAVESIMFEKMGRSNGPQKVKYRSIIFNLKDPKNPDFRRKVLLGQVKPERLADIAPEEMASDERQRENKQIKDKALFDCERGGPPKATTDQFKCGRCGQRKCTYYQLQTRSADEPMTTFVTCVNCNNHWKFC
ncbi:transcription elongation factor TFIIS [Diospyros lotus]|uniref:transcription elongation factor TFIIS n=1 Tax=Diospyros lotus TaxID=55363 RepID=UPI00225B7BC5|nr:transcription elongation factor TFIIS [Diospyros lotus]